MAATVAGGLFNAFAFAGASWIFSKVEHGNYEKEQKRHDLAEEQLKRESELWSRKEIEMRDEIEKQKIELDQADEDLKAGDDALDNYYKMTHEYNEFTKKKPKLEDFYKPSKEFQNYLTVVKITMIAGGVYVVSRYII